MKLIFFWFIIITPNPIHTSFISSVSYFVLFCLANVAHITRMAFDIDVIYVHCRSRSFSTIIAICYFYLFSDSYTTDALFTLKSLIFFNHWPHQHQSIHVLKEKTFRGKQLRNVDVSAMVDTSVYYFDWINKRWCELNPKKWNWGNLVHNHHWPIESISIHVFVKNSVLFPFMNCSFKSKSKWTAWTPSGDKRTGNLNGH